MNRLKDKIIKIIERIKEKFDNLKKSNILRLNISKQEKTFKLSGATSPGYKLYCEQQVI